MRRAFVAVLIVAAGCAAHSARPSHSAPVPVCGPRHSFMAAADVERRVAGCNTIP